MSAGAQCPACKALLAAGAKFCSECGGKVPAGGSVRPDARSGERRQVTILFADITGYTRLSSEIDPEELHALLGRYFGVVDRIIQDHGGTVDKHIGDAVMGVFGAPMSHGNDPERAVRAALGIHAAMERLGADVGRRISVHIGVANGEVVAASTGSDVHSEYTVLGDAVNLASRLDGIAGDGETVISDRVYQAVAALLEVESGGEVTVKGLADPVRVFRVLRLREREEAFRTAFVGREEELSRFRGVLSEAREGRGSVLHLRGEPGIGKTRLASEMRAEATRQGFASHTGLVLDFGTGRGQDAVRSIVLGLLELSLDASLEQRAAALSAALGEGRIVAEVLPAANDLLSIPQPSGLRGRYEALSESMRAEVKRRCVVGLLERAARVKPLCVAVEDVHWADGPTLDALGAIAGLTERARLVLLVTSRVDGDPLGDGFWSGLGGVRRTRLDLGPLGKEAAEALGERFSGVESRRLRACVERSGGNPLFLEQLLMSEAEGVLPDTVQSLVQARMDRLDPRDKRALQAASVIGQRFSSELLRHLLEDPSYECGSLMDRGLARHEGEDWLFSHALVRDGAYSSLLRQARRQLHRRAATWFGNSDPVLRAEHLDRAEDEAAPRAYLEAARSCIESFAYDDGLRLLGRGRELAKEALDRYALAFREGELRLYRADSPGAIASFEAAVQHASSSAERCRAYIGMADALRIVESVTRARECLAMAEGFLEPQGMDAERSRLHRVAGSLKFSLAEDSLGDQELALESALRSGDLELEARALSCLGDAHYMAGNVRMAHEYFGRCIDLCRRHGLNRVEMYQYYMLGITKWLNGDCRAGIRTTEQGLELASRSGHVRAEMLALETLGLLLTEAGDFGAAIDLLDRALPLAESMGSALFRAVLLAERVEALLRSGREEEGRAAGERIHEDSIDSSWWFVRPIVLPVRAWLAADIAEMDRILDGAEQGGRSRSRGMMMLLFHVHAFEACLARGNDARAAYHARALGEAEPDSKYFQLMAELTLAIVQHRSDPRDSTVLVRLSALRADAGRAGLGGAIAMLDRALAG